MCLSIGVHVGKIKLLRYSRSGQPLGDHRLAREVSLTADIAVVVELTGECIQRLADGCLIVDCHAAAVRHHGDGGVLCSMTDVRVSIELIAIFMRGIAAIVCRL